MDVELNATVDIKNIEAAHAKANTLVATIKEAKTLADGLALEIEKLSLKVDVEVEND